MIAKIPITLNQDTPMEVVIQMFQRLGLRSVLFTNRGALVGMLTKMVSYARLACLVQKQKR